MNEFPKWKYILVGRGIAAGRDLRLAGVFPQQPAVQISANRNVTVDAALKEKVLGILQTKKFDFKDVELNGDRMAHPFSEHRRAACSASGELKTQLGDQYVVALNLASHRTWLVARDWSNRMPLGLDLQGGVHFLMEIDQKAATAKMQQRYVDDIRTALRNAKIRYESVNAGAAGHRCNAAFG